MYNELRITRKKYKNYIYYLYIFLLNWLNNICIQFFIYYLYIFRPGNHIFKILTISWFLSIIVGIQNRSIFNTFLKKFNNSECSTDWINPQYSVICWILTLLKWVHPHAALLVSGERVVPVAVWPRSAVVRPSPALCGSLRHGYLPLANPLWSRSPHRRPPEQTARNHAGM